MAVLYALLARPGQSGYGLIESPTMWLGMGQLVRDTAPLVAAARLPGAPEFLFGAGE